METYIEAGEFGEGDISEALKNNKRAGGAYKWTKVRNRASGAQFCVCHWKLMVGDGGVW